MLNLSLCLTTGGGIGKDRFNGAPPRRASGETGQARRGGESQSDRFTLQTRKVNLSLDPRESVELGGTGSRSSPARWPRLTHRPRLALFPPPPDSVVRPEEVEPVTFERKYGPVKLISVGPRSSVFATVAAALEVEAIGSIEVRQPLGSLKELLSQNIGVDRQPELFCFGLLEQFDVPQLRELIAPRPVVEENPSCDRGSVPCIFCRTVAIIQRRWDAALPGHAFLIVRRHSTHSP